MLSSALWCQSHKLDPNVHSTISGAHIDNTLECVCPCVCVGGNQKRNFTSCFPIEFFSIPFFVIVKMFGKKS